ncbi:MAG: dnaJ 1 [Gemmataceae bacterium]|nr:dnaJ 1 [Gemmataceae bacterium]
MSTPELPDDPRAWPADPFALLGVPRGAGEMEIKRAYTRLIRRFKPEHSPEQFRRIREAYEACLEQGPWFFPARDFPTPDFVRAPVSPTAETPPADATSGATPLPEPAPIPHTPVVDEVDRLWDAAAEGRDGDAYTGLVELTAARPDRTELPLRLYWLLALNPLLDQTRTRRDWLAAALVRARLSGPAAELYRRELAFDPEPALYGPYLGLLESPAPPQDLLIVARWRLAAAGRTRSWHTADTDLAALAKVIPDHDESTWLGYVVAVLDWAAWERPQPLFARARDELDRLRHLELSHSYAFDRVEETAYLAADFRWGVEGGGPGNLLRLVPAAWAAPHEPPAAAVEAAVAAVAADATGCLYRLDDLIRDRGPGLLTFLCRILDRYRRTLEPDEAAFPPDLIRGLATAFPGDWPEHYSLVRARLLGFLTAEAIDPNEFADACGVHPDRHIQQVANEVRTDVGLRLAWLAGRLYRG